MTSTCWRSRRFAAVANCLDNSQILLEEVDGIRGVSQFQIGASQIAQGGALAAAVANLAGNGQNLQEEVDATLDIPQFQIGTPQVTQGGALAAAVANLASNSQVLLVELETQKGKPTEHEALRVIGNLTTPDGLLSPPDMVKRVGIGSRMRMVFSDVAPGLSLPQWTIDETAQQPAKPWRYVKE